MELQNIKATLQKLLAEIETELRAEYVDSDLDYYSPNDTASNDLNAIDSPEENEYDDTEEFIPPLQSELEMLKRNAGMISAYDDVPSINPMSGTTHVN